MENNIKANNNRLALCGLIALGVVCVGVSVGVLIVHPTGASELFKTTFAPVGLITAGFLGFIKH